MVGTYTARLKGSTALINRSIRSAGLSDSTKTNLLTQTGREVVAVAKSRAPGDLATGISGGIEKRGNRTVYEITVRPARSSGVDRKRGGRFRAEWALDASRNPRYRYRSGPRRGRLTRSWFRGSKTGVLRKMKTRVDAEVAKAIRGRG